MNEHNNLLTTQASYKLIFRHKLFPSRRLYVNFPKKETSKQTNKQNPYDVISSSYISHKFLKPVEDVCKTLKMYVLIATYRTILFISGYFIGTQQQLDFYLADSNIMHV